MPRITIRARDIQPGDHYVTGHGPREISRNVVGIVRNGDRVEFDCDDFTTPILHPMTRIRVDRERQADVLEAATGDTRR